MTDGNKELGTRNRAGDPARHAAEASPAPPGRGFKGLQAWQKADELASAVYRAMAPLRPAHGWLASQAMRAAVSVPANIAEGYARGSLGDYLRFLDIARGSLAELEYYIHFFERETLLPSADIARLRDLQSATGRILHGLWRSLKQKARDGTWDHAGLVRDEPESYVANGSDSDEEATP